LNFTERMADFTVKMRDLELSEELTEQFKKVFLDYLCAAITGSQTEVGRKIFQYFQGFDGNQMSTILGHSVKLSHVNAAFVNGTSAHCLDFDDGYTKGSVHPGSVVFPAVFAVAEILNSSKDDVIRAVIVGYEVTIRIASVIHPSSRENGYHNTPVAGVFGAAAAVSYLLGLTKEQVIGAFGNASSFAGGTFAFLGSGSEIKRLHPGIAARDGIIAAEMASLNLLGPSAIFEKAGGVFDIFARGKINVGLAGTPIGQDLAFMNVYIKPYPCCRHLHVVIDAIKRLKETHRLSWDQIDKIKVGVNRVASRHGHHLCKSLLDAQMSIPYAVAAMLLDDRITVKSFHIERHDRRQHEHLMHKVEVFEDEDCEKLYPQKRKTNIVIHTKTNDLLTISYDEVKGEHPNPMSVSDLEKKLKENCNDIIGEEKVEDIIRKVKVLDILNGSV
jgi:2-methylcitrate dehydratase PrpD